MADEQKGLFIPRKILYNPNLGNTAKLVYAVMVEGKDADNICRMSSQDIADRLLITKAAANNARLQLCRLGYVQLIPGTQKNYLIKAKKKKGTQS